MVTLNEMYMIKYKDTINKINTFKEFRQFYTKNVRHKIQISVRELWIDIQHKKLKRES